ncbi:hypothetical protein [Paludisphaera soli]|uniref:hypothetical protein n=1 Tax=Paludisphaera soli TaxID=2712865 RepID=UPI0013ED1FB4|nr:hypothetical protein [Paludisphaera soli]
MDWTMLAIPIGVSSLFWGFTLGERWIRRQSRRMAQRRVIEGIRFQCLAYGRCTHYTGGGN